MSTLSAVSYGGEKVDVWVLLSEPSLAGNSGSLQAVDEQQRRILTQLKALGAVELARVKRARNAVAVSVDPAKLTEIKRIPGVRTVSPVRHIERDPPPLPVQ